MHRLHYSAQLATVFSVSRVSTQIWYGCVQNLLANLSSNQSIFTTKLERSLRSSKCSVMDANSLTYTPKSSNILLCVIRSSLNTKWAKSKFKRWSMKISKNHLDIFLPLNHIFRMKFSCLIKKDLKSMYTTDFRTVSASTKSFTMRFKASRYQSAKLQII